MKEKYDLLELISEDEFDKLYKAKLKNTEEFRAIKIINKNSMIEEIGEEYFQNVLKKSFENMALCCQNNNYSIKLYEHFDTENELDYVMELMDENLNQFLKKKDKGLNPQEVL